MIWLVKTRDQIPAKERELLARRTREIIKLKLATRRKKKICQAT